MDFNLFFSRNIGKLWGMTCGLRQGRLFVSSCFDPALGETLIVLISKVEPPVSPHQSVQCCAEVDHLGSR